MSSTDNHNSQHTNQDRRDMIYEQQYRSYDSQIAKDAVKEVFALLGVDVDDPAKVEEFRKDLRFGGDMRRMRDRGVLAIIGVFFTAIGVAIVSAFFKNGGGH